MRTERRDRYPQNVYPVKKVGPEPAGGDHREKIAVRRANQTESYRSPGLRAEPAYDAILEDAKKLRLQGKTKIADLIKKKRSAVGFLEEPFAIANGTRIASAACAKKRAFRDRLRYARYVAGNKRTGRNGGPFVNHPRDKFLSSPGFTRNHHRDPRIPERLDAGAEGNHFLASTDQNFFYAGHRPRRSERAV